ncbi:dynein heavy chain, putative [Trypanosoma brucei brucei TREU927]|uniref:Dynein heavy chain, putative n=2 Tax=Trypanosoma brucei TaxID=5691 RepID=Q57YY8_TRYB2|nr:dynein heavy chain, putative [Trypanosoma brucei brucei TREU927]AAX79673.1 dynein heavy chain, putative [Trypanosoma brucei]AAZ13090.1 dynein heavy chain, putative [Trypanosoma brucei brucei TREU927]
MTSRVKFEVAEEGVIPECHPECTVWMLQRIQAELQCKDEEFTNKHIRLINDFLVGDEDLHALFCYYSSVLVDVVSEDGEPSSESRSQQEMIAELRIVDGLPAVSRRDTMKGMCLDVVWFARLDPEKLIVPESVDTCIAWGVCRGGNLLEGFLRQLQYSIAPTLLQNRWPDSLEKDVRSALHRFMAAVTENVNRLKGQTVLYVPSDLFSKVDLAEAHQNRELVQGFEAVVIHWTRQIKEVVGDKDAGLTGDGAGPLQEIAYWRSRARDLGNIRTQLNRSDVGGIVQVLKNAKSFYYLEPFLNLRADVEKGTDEAFDSLRFLNTLLEPCTRLSRAGPKEIPSLIPDVLIHAQLILLYSKSYKKDRFFRLLRLISNEIIFRCSQEIDVPAILNGDVERSMVALRHSVAAGNAWIQECHKMLAATRKRFKMERGEKLDVDDSFLNEIDGFVRHRCQNLCEICKAQLQFGFKSVFQDSQISTDRTGGSRHTRGVRNAAAVEKRQIAGGVAAYGAPLEVKDLVKTKGKEKDVFRGQLPIFSGNKGPEIETQLLDIQRAFKAKIDTLRRLDYDILDVKSTRWVDDFRALKSDIDNLSMMLQQIITAAFDSFTTTEMGAEYIEAFFLVAETEELQLQLDRSKDRVFRMVHDRAMVVQGKLQRCFNKPPPIFYLHPPLAGHGMWAENNAHLLQMTTETLNHCYYLRESPESTETIQLVDRLDRSLRDTMRQKFCEWRANLPQNPGEYLERFLISKRPNPRKHSLALYDVNFASELLLLFAEARYWHSLGELLPVHIMDIVSKEERLRIYRESVAQAVRARNSIALSLTREECRLFSVRMNFLESKYMPGMTRLLWNSQGIVEYFVRECRQHVERVQHIVNEFKHGSEYVDHHCKAIADTIVVIFEKKKVYSIESFVEKQEAHRAATLEKLQAIHRRLVDKLFELLSYFRDDYAEDDVVRTEWHRLISKVELKVEEALRTMVKRTLQVVERMLPIEPSEDRLEEKVFKLDVVVTVADDTRPHIEPVPSVRKLSHDVNGVCKAIIGIVKSIPRLEESLQARVAQDQTDDADAGKRQPFQYSSSNTDSLALRGSYFEYMTSEQDAIYSLRHVRESFDAIEEKVRDKLTQTWQLHQSDTTDSLWTTQKQVRRIKQGWKLEDYRIHMDHVAQRREGINKQETFSDVLFLQLDFTKMKESFRKQCQLVITHYHSLLYADAKSEVDAIYKNFVLTIQALTKEPQSLDELGDQIKRCAAATEALPEISAKFGPIADTFALITHDMYNFGSVRPEDVRRCEGLQEKFEVYSEQLVKAQQQLAKYKEQFRHDVETDIRALSSNSYALRQKVAEEGPRSHTLSTEDAFAKLSSLGLRAKELRTMESRLQQGIEIFNLEKPQLDDLVAAEKELEILRKIWNLCDEWRRENSLWRTMYFIKLNSESMLDVCERIRKDTLRLRNELQMTDVWVNLKEEVELMKRLLPIVDDLRTPAIRPRHWEFLKVQLDATFNIDDESFCLNDLMEARVETQAEFVVNLATSAREEMKIETDLERIRTFWEDSELMIEPYQGYHKISGVDDINNALAEHLAQLSSMKMSRFVDSFRPKVIQWEQTLSIATDTIEALLTVQTKWMYLENIFIGSDDIKRKLAAESKKFDGVHSQWLAIITRFINDPNVVRGTRRDGLIDQLQNMNNSLEFIQKSLEGFLEDRRRVFPRFYFLSNDDLLEILGHTKDPSKVQPHLRKCFEGLYQLSLKTVRQRTVADAMLSSDGETVAFTPAVQVGGLPVESWLRRVEVKMREMMQKRINATVDDLQKSVFETKKSISRDSLKAWAERNEGQSIITASCINWTLMTESAITEYGELHSGGLGLQRRKASPLYKVYKRWKGMIKKYCQLVRQPQNRVQRSKLVALITIEVHSRDILRQVLAARVHQDDDFEWSRQLRFYREEDESTDRPQEGHKICLVRQTSATVRYDYEYLGNSGRLVVTGLTDRAYMTLTTALQLHRGGLPQGPAGTGKTETVKDLGKAIGKYVMVFNCSDGLDYKSVGRMLSGIAQTGSWSCFDEFNRIEVEVLSVVAQQILSILTAVSERKDHFLFEGSDIPLNMNCGLFVTMNPGYAGRSELPDNLKALLRPISMMVPDFALICEITLLSEGFEESETLSKKVSILYELMEKQLSKQDHYDFSLRNIKAVLVQAGNLKREGFPGTESQLCLKAMNDMNLPKFVKDDVPLFVGMLNDLFPGVEPGDSGLGALQEAAEKELDAEGLEVNAHIVVKTLQLWDTLRTRHGVMVVGQTGSGKTVTWRNLSGALRLLKEQNLEPGLYEPVRVSLLNPKSVTMDELYGSYNQATREWKDGILSDLMRQICRDITDTAYKWMLFDGPVDTLWIESMNTVLDDNKMLTLNSGERITLNSTVRMMFEVQDLSQASPATVSRCGMVYFNVEDLGWMPFFKTWLKSRWKFEITMGAPRPDDTISELQEYVKNTVTRVLEYRAHECVELVPTTTLNVVRSFTRMLDALASVDAEPFVPEAAHYATSHAGENYLPQLRILATFCLMWSAGGSLTTESRQKLDAFIRELDSSFPSTETIFEYFPDLGGLQWKNWNEHVDLQKTYMPATGTPYHKLIVPTVDTVRYEYIVSQLVRSQVQLVLVGTTGTGKSLIARQVLANLSNDVYVTTQLNFSAQTTAGNVQDIIEGRMEHKSKKVCCPPGGRRMICLVEDLNMPAKEKFGAQPPLELLRQWLDNGYWYDRNTRGRRTVNDLQLLCCMTYGRPDITPRLMSKLNVFNITFPSESVITKIFTSILMYRLEPYPELHKLVNSVVKATLQTYQKVSADLLPTPSKSHYLFNLRDLSKVFQGIYGCHMEYLQCKEHMVALWAHECFRVFSDRMNDPNDKAWFKNLICEKLADIFQTKWNNIIRARSRDSRNQAVDEKENPLFVDFWDGEYDEMAKYRLVPSLEALRDKVEEYLDAYNSEPGARQMNLVFFTDALEHLCRIHRIVRQPRGNALLVGLGGSGRYSLTRLATYLAGYSIFSIETHKKYDLDRFHEDLRSLYKGCGLKGQQRVFYFSDNQIMQPAFLEDLNNMLSTGEVPNLFPKDELQNIRDTVCKQAIASGYRDTPDEMYNFFIDRARTNLHLVVAMSPAHKLFRARLRQFPALVSCTSIDWFVEWPSEALREVGLRYLQETRENKEDDEHLGIISDFFVYMHYTTSTLSREMLEQVHRYNYVTPSSYLDMVRGFRRMLTQKRDEIIEQRDKLANGMAKLEETKLAVSKMTEELKVQDAKLQEKTEEVNRATESIKVQQQNAEEQQSLLASEKVKIEQTKRSALADQAEAQADLDRAMPTLLEAQNALDKLEKNDINEIKSYKTPAAMIRTVMYAVQTTLRRKLEWDEAKKSLSEPKFIDMLKHYHENNDMTDQRLLDKIEKYVKRPDFTPAAASAVSKAAGGLCQWVIAIHKYGNIYKEVHPKIVKNENAQQKVRAQEEMLRQKEEKLQRIMSEVKQLELALQQNVDEKMRLMQEAKETQMKLDRARIIVDGLEGEQDRWIESIARYEAALGTLVGDALLVCGFLCYAGAFTADYRQKLWLNWIKEIKRLQIAISKNFDFVEFLADPTEVRDWQQAGLPGDDFSKENGAVVMRGTRWPLMIDPQLQAIKWIKRMEKDKGLKVIDQKQPDFHKTVEYAVQFGCPLLLQDILEEIDPLLDSVLSKAIVRKGAKPILKIGDNYVEYNDNFKLYITTRLPNPHYTPEICSKVCLLNFAVRETGLEEQLLKIVVEKEKPELEQDNEQLILDTAEARKETKRLEDEILNLLSTSQVSLLENKKLVDTLQSARVIAANIKQQLKEAEITAEKIHSAREQYRECARRASILFFALADLGSIDAMYQFALDSYIVLFQGSIQRSAQKIATHTLEERVRTLNDWHTSAVYANTCRGLFEKHKLLFTFHMTIRILQAEGLVNIEEYVFLMRGGQVLDKQGRLPNPAPSWLSERAWSHILELDKLTNFHGVAASFEQAQESWKHWFLQENPEDAELPDDWQTRTADNYIQRMIFVRCLRPDRVIFMVYEFIEKQLGPQFVDPPPFNLKDTFEESTNVVPLVFVLSPGVDPTTQLAALAQREGRPLKTLALGQGQGENAKRAVQECSQVGGWVFLANCHLMVSWLVELEKIIEDLVEQRPHKEFRLWLSSVPTTQFPIGILQRAIKMTTEPPTGIKANMLRLYNQFSEEQFAEHTGSNPQIYCSLLFALCFFHSILLERRKFGNLGYNVVYDFTTSDFEVSENIIALYIGNMATDRVEDIPFVTIRYLIAEASYGGRVTDDWDRRVINTYISQFMCPAILTEERYPLSAAEEYYIPSGISTLQAYKDECSLLPITDPPEAFGQHTNADIASRVAESTMLLDNLISVNKTLARGGGSSGGASKGMSEEARCLEILASLEEPSKTAIPNPIDYDAVYESVKEDTNNALNTCLLQEIQRYNVLLRKIIVQKRELRRAVKGEVLMTDELEAVFNALLLSRVPPPWTSAYPSMKPLASWAVDLVERIEQMKQWGQRVPNVFWLSGFTYPTGFLKGLQQQQARHDRISIDQYTWEFVVLPSEERTIVNRAKKGAYVRGIFLEGAGWNEEMNTLCEPRPLELIVPMPIIHFKPKIRDTKPRPPTIYECPLYMYPLRTGTRERPSFVVAVDLESGEAVPEHYTKRGTALLLSTDE